MKKAIRLVNVARTQSVCRTPDGDEGVVYGLAVAWSDGSQSRADDLGTSPLAVATLADQLAGSDLEKIHFWNVIEDFLA